MVWWIDQREFTGTFLCDRESNFTCIVTKAPNPPFADINHMQFLSLHLTHSILGAASTELFGSARVELKKNWDNREIEII